MFATSTARMSADSSAARASSPRRFFPPLHLSLPASYVLVSHASSPLNLAPHDAGVSAKTTPPGSLPQISPAYAKTLQGLSVLAHPLGQVLLPVERHDSANTAASVAGRTVSSRKRCARCCSGTLLSRAPPENAVPGCAGPDCPTCLSSSSDSTPSLCSRIVTSSHAPQRRPLPRLSSDEHPKGPHKSLSAT